MSAPPYSSVRISPTLAERYFLAAILVVLSALPFLLGTQPHSLVPNEEAVLNEGDPTKQLTLVLMYATVGAVLVHRNRFAEIMHLGVPFILLVILCFASTLWSDVPFLAFRRSVALVGTVIVGLYAALRFDILDLVRVMCRAVAIVLIASFLLAAVDSSLGLDPEGRLRGVFAHKNGLGVFAALGLLMLAARPVQAFTKTAWILHSALAGGCVLALAMAQSISPLPPLCIGLALLIWLRRSNSGSHWVVGPVLTACCMVGLVLPFWVNDLGMLATMLGRDADYSGRDRAWEFSIELFKRNPWLGYGYGTIWDGPAGTLFLRWAHFSTPHAHNGYLQMALDTGSIGLTLLLCAVVVMTVRALRLRSSEQARMLLPIAFLGLYLLYNATEAYLWTQNELLTVLIVFFVARTNLMYRQFGVRHTPFARQVTTQTAP